MTPEKRHRRTPEEIVAELQQRIAKVQARAAAKALRASPTAAATLTALKSIDKALGVAAQANASELRRVLAEVRKPIAEFLDAEGLRLPKARVSRGPRTHARAKSD